MRLEVHFAPGAFEHLDARLADHEDKLAYLQPALERIADDFLGVERIRLNGGGGLIPLTPEWAARKAAGGRSPAPLAGGELEQSLTTGQGRYGLRQITDTSVLMGTTDPVANLMNSGTRKMPKRPPVSVTFADESRWFQILDDHISGQPVGL